MILSGSLAYYTTNTIRFPKNIHPHNCNISQIKIFKSNWWCTLLPQKNPHRLNPRINPSPNTVQHKSSQIAQYADNTVLFYKSIDTNRCTKVIQDHMELITKWSNKWRLKLNASNTVPGLHKKEARHHTHDNWRPHNLPCRDCQIPYLGIYLDKKLNFKKHFKHIKKKMTHRIHQLYPIFRSQSIPLQKKTHIYKTIIRVSMLYGAPSGVMYQGGFCIHSKSSKIRWQECPSVQIYTP